MTIPKGKMSNDSQQIVNKAWNFAHVLRDDGLFFEKDGLFIEKRVAEGCDP